MVVGAALRKPTEKVAGIPRMAQPAAWPTQGRTSEKGSPDLAYTTVFVRGIARISFPVGANLTVRRRAQRLYQPFGRLSRLLYKLWCHFPLNIYVLSQKPTRQGLRFPNFDWQGWLVEVASKLGAESLTPIFWFPPHFERTRTFVILQDAVGRPVACAKLADGDAKQSITSEITALNSLNNLRFENFGYPKILISGAWTGIPYVVLSYEDLPLSVSRKWEDSHTRIWSEFIDKTGKRRPVKETLWRDLPAKWREVRRLIEAGRSGSQFLHCTVHGDFAPWNMFQASDQQILIDWERFAPSAPYFTDPSQFTLNIHLWGHKESARDCATALRVLSETLQAAPEDVALSLAYLAATDSFPGDFLHDVTEIILVCR